MAAVGERTLLMAQQREATASAIVRALVREGPQGRKRLAERTGTSFTTITKVVAELLDAGALVESVQVTAARGVGRPAVPLDLPGAARSVVGVHLHPERISCAAYDLRGTELAARAVAASGRSAAERLAEAAELVLDVVAEVGRSSVVGVGVASPWADQRPGQPSRLLVDISYEDLVAGLGERIPFPLRVDSNVRSMAVEQHWWGGVGGDVLTVLVGRTVAVAQMRNDELVWDGRASGGIVAHLTVPGSAEPCDCGQRGCVRATCTDDALLARAVAAGALGPDAVQKDLFDGDAAAGPAVAGLRRERAQALGLVLPSLIALVDPEVTIVRGRFGTADDVEELLTSVRSRHLALVGRETDVRRHEDAPGWSWAHASAALAVDRYLAAPLHAEARRARSAG